ncbi:MAG: ATP-binding protein [Mariprofundus sp.]
MTGNLYLAKLRTRDMPDVVQKLENIESISFRAADMIQQLLVFARKDRVSMEPLSLNALITKTLNALRIPLYEHIHIDQAICIEPLQVNGDAAKLRDVLLNLMDNARDALGGTDEASIIVKLEAWHADDAMIEKHPYIKAGAYAHMSVADNGCGIPAHQKEHLFEPFFTTREVGKGTGLGLAMVFGAIKTHHGFVEVDSIEGKGSTFHVYLPLLTK